MFKAIAYREQEQASCIILTSKQQIIRRFHSSAYGSFLAALGSHSSDPKDIAAQSCAPCIGALAPLWAFLTDRGLLATASTSSFRVTVCSLGEAG